MKYPPSLNKPGALDEFVFYATDQKGHHSTLPKVAIPPEMDQLLNEIMASGDFRYRTKLDIVRDALYHRLKWLCDNQGLGHGDLLKRIKAIDAILAEEETSYKYLERMEALDRVINRVSDSMEYQRQLVHSFFREIQQMADSHWKSRYLKHLEERYGHLLPRALCIRPSAAVHDEERE
ncbi:MAG: hypothetical protein ISS52_04400 [Dehalococcoidia bacterium]|nr:hypothetical protein [Dehalococcoidia bacterium]